MDNAITINEFTPETTVERKTPIKKEAQKTEHI
jgi:hypothetical protein